MGCPESTEQGEEISDDGYDPCVFDYLVHGSPHPISVYAAQGWRHQVGKVGNRRELIISKAAARMTA